YRAGVHVLEVREAARWRDIAGEASVVGGLMVVGELDARPSVQGARLEAELVAATHLGAQARVPHELRGEHASIVGAGHREVRLERGEIVGLLPRLAECATDPGLAEPGNPPPGLLADHPAPAHLGVELVAHLRPEG